MNMENVEFAQLKKQAESIRGYFLHPLVMEMNNYRPSDIEALHRRLIAYIDAMQQISEFPDTNRDAPIEEQVKSLVEYINEFEVRFSAIDTDDREHLGDIIDAGVILAGYSVKPEENPYFDITKKWRKW